MALFPRKVNVKYAMLSRLEDINNYIILSDRKTPMNDPTPLYKPKIS